MDRRLLAIPIILLFGVALLLSGLMNGLTAGPEEVLVEPESPAPEEPETVLQKVDAQPPVVADKDVVNEGGSTSGLAPSGGAAPASSASYSLPASKTPAPAATPAPVPQTIDETKEGGDVMQIDEVKANFTYDVKCLSVTLTNTSENATSVSWDFGDGNTSTLSSLMYTYSAEGTYNVNLTAMGDNDQVDYKEVSITVSDCSEPVDVDSEPVVVEYPDNGQTCPSESIPEFPTVALPMLAIIGLAFFFNRKQ